MTHRQRHISEFAKKVAKEARTALQIAVVCGVLVTLVYYAVVMIGVLKDLM